MMKIHHHCGVFVAGGLTLRFAHRHGTDQGLHTIVACHSFHLGPNGGRMPGVHGGLMMDVRFVETSVGPLKKKGPKNFSEKSEDFGEMQIAKIICNI